LYRLEQRVLGCQVAARPVLLEALLALQVVAKVASKRGMRAMGM
jgi:hypothetical protein